MKWLAPLRRLMSHNSHNLPARHSRSRGRRIVLALEYLEDRTLPTVLTVGAGDVNGLIAAINTANTDGLGDTIQLTAGSTYNLTLTGVNNTTNGPNGLPVITAAGVTIETTVSGQGATIEGAGTANSFRLFDVASGSNVTLKDLTLMDGVATGSQAQGGALFNNGGNVTMTNVVFKNNQANAGVGQSAQGGAIYSSGGSLILNNCTVSANTAAGGAGANGAASAGHHNGGATGTGGAGQGGGIYAASGSLTLTNDTLAWDFLETFTNKGAQAGQGGGLYNAAATINLANTIIAINEVFDTAGSTNTPSGFDDLASSVVTSSEPNLIGSNAADPAYAPATAPLGTGTSRLFAAPVTSFLGINGQFVGNNGGPTPTLLLVANSPASGAGDASTGAGSPLAQIAAAEGVSIANATDQRGLPRVVNNQIDIGATQGGQAQSSGTTTDLSSSTSGSSVFGQSVTFTATVTAASGNTPTGSVDFTDTTTGQDLGSFTLQQVNGVAQASVTLSSLTAISHVIEAAYTSDNSSAFANSNSPTLTQVVNKATPTVSVSDAGGVYHGSPFAATATMAGVVAGVDTTPAASLEGVTPTLDYKLLNPDGTVAQDLGATAPTNTGAYSVIASFAGSADYTNASAQTTFQITQANTSTTLNASANPSIVGQSVTLTASVSVQSSGAGTPTGTVTFQDGSTVLGTGTLQVVNGVDQATFTTSTLAVRNHSITAVYSGDTNFVTSSSTTLSQAVDYATTTTLSAPSSSVFGQAITLRATVKAVVANAGTPTGTVTFRDGSTVLGTATLQVVNGVDQATLKVSSLAVGSHSLTAVYGGDSNFAVSTSPAVSEKVNQANSKTTLSSSASSAVWGQSVTFTATVSTVSPGAGTPTGTVTFQDGSTVLGTGTLQVVNGVDEATFTTSALAVGSHSITAVYSGDSDFVTSTSSSVREKINKASTTTTLSSSVNPSSFGQPVTFTATIGVVAPGAGTPTGTVTFKDGSKMLGTATLHVVNGVV
jgi:hypothetical protein